MNIREFIDIVESDYVQGKKTALLTLLQLLKKKAKENNSDIKISFEAFSELMTNTGYSFDFQEFEYMTREDPNLLDLINDYDADYLVIGHSEQSQDDPFDDDSEDFDFPDDDFGADDNSEESQDSLGSEEDQWDNQNQQDTGHETVKKMAQRATNKRS